jgi:2-polyprenyl-3-methyl-5-hydroxy-6-metoxy-1,4-benzoquinol methylase
MKSVVPLNKRRSEAALVDRSGQFHRLMDEHWKYEGRELESMWVARNYRRWILRRLNPFLGQRIVEVGAGDGSFSELLLERKPQSLTSIEPSANMYPLLVKKLARIDPGHTVRAIQSTLMDTALQYPEIGDTDSIVYINVLEHVEDDQSELRTAHSMLASGGRVLVFVPAHEWLMSRFDRKLGHFRRYTRESLMAKFKRAGFTIRFSAYFDVLGIFPWWLKYRILQSEEMEASLVRAFDRCGVPLSRAFDLITNFRIGKNVIVVGEKSPEAASSDVTFLANR